MFEVKGGFNERFLSKTNGKKSGYLYKLNARGERGFGGSAQWPE